MSDYRAIQGVSSSIKNLLETFMFLNRADVASDDRVKITVGLPDQDAEGKRVNLFLYQVTECPYLKNQDLPGAAGAGEYGHPPVVLDLHYLLTAYAESDEGDQIEAHQIMGDAMRALHDHPYLVGDILDPSLEDAVEPAKITLEPLTVEDVTKVWVALNTPYRLSVGYKATVVQIQSRIQRSAPGLIGEGPGGGVRVVVAPIARPRIDEALVIRQGDATNRERVAYARIGDRLALKGQNLSGDARLLLNDEDATASIVSKKPNRMEATIPDIAALQPGPVTIRVSVDILLGDPPVPHRGVSSNLSVFVLVPRVTQLTVTAGNPPQLDPHGVRLFQDGKECMTLVGDRVVPPAAYTTSETDHIVLPAPANLPAGTYPVRVRVNGAESFDVHNLVI
ncbi:MAG: DUF4255 domain-containing protein [Bryobacteraceae bacterium]|nr:DUF4255 domain-containing protein [Bryobacteraceae bacterium]